jgi:hypothetical protein
LRPFGQNLKVRDERESGKIKFHFTKIIKHPHE